MNFFKFVFISAVVSGNLVSCLNNEKVSLTFVIDDTWSMYDDIVQVRNGANEIFDTFMKSKESEIENFVLVTFNDPTTEVRANTKERDVLKNALASISVNGGGVDCAEYCMSGIKRALEESLPGSYLYVFTDATAHDYEMFEEVENMASQLRSQVVFVLTGKCGASESNTDFQVYPKLAKATGGEVFHLEKHELNKILVYLKEQVQAPFTLFASKSFPSGRGTLNFTTDEKTKDLVITASGDRPELTITEPDGRISTPTVLVDTNKIKILKLPDVKPGAYTVEVDGESELSVKAVARSEVQFNFGFSTFIPSSFNDVTSRPVPDTKSYISVQLTEGDLEMRAVKIYDMDEKQIDEIPLKVLDLNQKLYITNLSELPNTLFRIAVTGFDTGSGTIITRVASFPVTPQRITGPVTVNKAPIVTTDKDKVNVSYDDSLQLICKVSGFPKPDINWIDEEGTTLEAEVIIVDLPYDYISILNIEHARTNNTYHCKARNYLGEDGKSIKVEVTREHYMNILEKPQDIGIKFKTQAKLYCKVESYPESEITWYKNGNVLPIRSSNIELKDNNTVLKINNMQPDDVGVYLCEVRNDDGRQMLQAKVSITGADPPVIDKLTTSVHVKQDSDAVINCKLLEGSPRPSIVWYKINLFDEEMEITDAKDKESITLYNVQKIDKGAILCEVENDIGHDYHEVELIVDYPPSIKSSIRYMRVIKGNDILLSCEADAEPEPDVVWDKNGKPLLFGEKIVYKDDNMQITSATVDDSGNYTCVVMNSVGTAQKTLFVDVTEPPVIDKLTTSVHVKQSSDVVINCKLLEGLPRPSIAWYKTNLFGEEMEVTDAKDKESITLRNVQKIDKGTIICEAQNDIGQDYHEIELIVDYPPSIKSALKYVRVKEGNDILLSCDADAEPEPDVVWDKNGKPLLFEDKIVYKVYGIQIPSVTVDDIGNYTCLVINSIGTAQKTIFVDVTVPVQITPPENKILRVEVGSQLFLPCHAEGFPKPLIKWTYQSFKSSDIKIIKNELSSDESTFSQVNRIQIDEEGYYTCKASNPGSTDSVTYEVHVLAPPTIENTYAEKIFKAVEGDLALRIDCKAFGNPKPKIRWLKDNLYVALGDSYDIDTNGTLVIKNIDKTASGLYVCEAQNDMGRYMEIYEVEVRESPRVRSPSATVFIEYGSTSTIECKVPHKLTDRLRWYKRGMLIREGALTITNANLYHSGIYTCRVSDFFKSKSNSIKVNVGYKPTFIKREQENIELAPGNPNFLSCEARGFPKPEITWWFNEAKLDSTDMVYSVEYSLRNKGTYYCSVRNQFGSIYRRFIISTRDCAIELDKMKSSLQPLMLSKAMTWPTYQTDDGHMIIPKDDYVILFCQEKFKNFPQLYVTAYCDGGSKFKINGSPHEYSDFECTEPYNNVVKSTGKKCLPYGNTEKFKIVLEALHRTVEVYEVCFSHDIKMPIYTKHYMPRTSMGSDVEEKWTNDDVFKNADFDSMYDCDNQIQTISSSLRKWFHKDDKCCFRKRQLVNQKDVVPGVAQRAVFSYLNVVPQWSTCTNNNWDEIENQVRLLSQSTHSDLLVWSGASVGLTLKTSYDMDTFIYITDGRRHYQPIPKYIWKVIQDPATQSSLAIIQLNIPDLKWSDVRKHRRCRNICDRIEWMNSYHWNDVDRGFVYCCSLYEFEQAFGLGSVFEPHYKVLSRVDSYAALK